MGILILVLVIYFIHFLIPFLSASPFDDILVEEKDSGSFQGIGYEGVKWRQSLKMVTGLILSIGLV